MITKTTILNLFITLYISSFAQTPSACEKIFDQTPDMIRYIHLNPDTQYVMDNDVFKLCGKLEDIDIAFMKGPMMGMILTSDTIDIRTLTYRKLIAMMQEYKATDEYKKLRELVLLERQLENKKVDTNTWEQDKIFFTKAGWSAKELDSFKLYISRPECSSLNYKQAFIMFKARNEVLYIDDWKGKFEFKELTNYEAALKESKKEKKPLLLYFNGHAVVNARKMEMKIDENNAAKSIISKNYIFYTVYVDERTPLPAKEQYVSKRTGERIEQVGQKWSDLQIGMFNTSYQPYFVIIDVNGNKIADATYDSDINVFVEFLKKGL